MRFRSTIKLLLLIFLLSGTARAATTHYIRAGATGTADGSDWNNAFTDIPTTQVRGDTYYIAGGSYGSHTFNTADSGTTLITILRATVSDHGTSTGWISGYDSQVTFAYALTFSSDYWLLDGRTGTTFNMSTYGFVVAQPASCSTSTQHYTVFNAVHDITIKYMAIRTCDSSFDAEKYCFYNSIGSFLYNLTLNHCYGENMQGLVYLVGASNVVTEWCYTTNAFSSSSHHGEVWDFITIGTPNQNCTVRYCIAADGTGTGTLIANDSGGDNLCILGLDVYGCVFRNGSGGNGVIGCTTHSGMANARIYNNTFLNNSAIWLVEAQAASSATVVGYTTNNVATNNLVYNQSASLGSYGATPWFHDYNYYVSCTSVPTETHGATASSDPFVNDSAFNFHLLAATPAGLTLPSTYNTDPDGNTRGADGVWDRGAFEFVAGCDPCITGQPGNQTVNCGSTATWTVTATGNTTLSYQWYKNGSAVSGATQSTYTTPATTGSDNSSTWYCAVTDTAGTLNSSTATLSIELILTQPANQTVSVGQNATFSVSATTCVTSYQWNRNGSSISGATQSSFTEVNCQLSQNGNTYSCAVGTAGESETSATATLTVGGITNWYASPTGSSGNTGLSTSSPWDVATAINNVGNSNIINFMDGDYTPANCPGNNTITNYWVTLKAINKWKPRFINLASDGTGGVFRNLTGGAGDGLLVDGLQFSNCQFYPILIRKQGTTNVVIRNNWIHNTGQTWTSVAGGQSGIEVYPSQSWLIERNLLEHNGTNGANAGFNHGLYLAGTNGIARDNVIRYNGGLGISVDGHTGNLDVNNQFYCNLIYSNLDASDATYTGQQLSIYNDGYSTGGPYTNYIFCNTIISQGTTPIFLQGSIDAITNNIITCGATGSGHDGIGRFASDTSATWVDYNLRNVAFQFTGTHDIVSSSYGFLNTGKGLYWLTSGSAARSAALSGVFPPADFFGNTISSVSDIGAFQYSATYATYTRTLDPSPVAGADYWSALSLNTLSHSISGQIKFSGNIVLK